MDSPTIGHAHYRARQLCQHLLKRTQNMTITLADLQAKAIGTQRAGATPYHAKTVEEARSDVKVKDGNRKPAEDGSQALTVVLGKHTLPLDCIKPGTSRVVVTAEEVEAYTAALVEAVNGGMFDEAIEKAQVLGKAQAEKAAANPRNRAPKAVEAVEETEGLDLDELEGIDG